ncbi:hypothetical protein, partial [Burkholderia cenocepacia]|uniref:hypothetical protein n=1 Tax=Burkholderia cenocepacia TaxID=95486 RepID=UPI0019555933
MRIVFFIEIFLQLNRSARHSVRRNGTVSDRRGGGRFAQPSAADTSQRFTSGCAPTNAMPALRTAFA